MKLVWAIFRCTCNKIYMYLDWYTWYSLKVLLTMPRVIWVESSTIYRRICCRKSCATSTTFKPESKKYWVAVSYTLCIHVPLANTWGNTSHVQWYSLVWAVRCSTRDMVVIPRILCVLENTRQYINLYSHSRVAISLTNLPDRHGTVVWYAFAEESCLASVMTH